MSSARGINKTTIINKIFLTHYDLTDQKWPEIKKNNQKSDIPMSERMSEWSKRSKGVSERSAWSEAECGGAKRSMAEQSVAWRSKAEHGGAKGSMVERSRV